MLTVDAGFYNNWMCLTCWIDASCFMHGNGSYCVICVSFCALMCVVLFCLVWFDVISKLMTVGQPVYYFFVLISSFFASRNLWTSMLIMHVMLLAELCVWRLSNNLFHRLIYIIICLLLKLASASRGAKEPCPPTQLFDYWFCCLILVTLTIHLCLSILLYCCLFICCLLPIIRLSCNPCEFWQLSVKNNLN
jgi:hypothetical protein